MSSGDFTYIATERGAEEQVLPRLEPWLARLTGDHTVRIKRGSGWVLVEMKEVVDSGAEIGEIIAETVARDLSEDQKACQLSRELGVDVLHVGWVGSVSGVTFRRCRGGEQTRRFWYTPEEERNHGFYPDEGPPEAWENPFRTKGLRLTDLGKALALPGIDQDRLVEDWEGLFDLKREIQGKPVPKRQAQPTEELSKAWELVAPAIIGAALAFLAGFATYRRIRSGEGGQ